MKTEEKKKLSTVRLLRKKCEGKPQKEAATNDSSKEIVDLLSMIEFYLSFRMDFFIDMMFILALVISALILLWLGKRERDRKRSGNLQMGQDIEEASIPRFAQVMAYVQ